MREKWRFSIGGFNERKREVERDCVEVEDDFGEKEGSPQSKPVTTTRSKLLWSMGVTTAQSWCLLDTNFLGFLGWAPQLLGCLVMVPDTFFSFFPSLLMPSSFLSSFIYLFMYSSLLLISFFSLFLCC